MSEIKLILGDCLEQLKLMPSESIDCCVTSPPYWGLRDYGVTGQLGLEKTPEEYAAKMVEVFGEVKRVLKKEGTCWLNLGDSYNGSGGNHKEGMKNDTGFQGKIGPRCGGKYKMIDTLKPKDLVGIPWAVAKALQAPYYTGRIKSERDRIYLAATIDAEGTICGFTHKRKDNGEIRRGIHITITNSNLLMLDECYRIWPTSRQDHNAHGIGHFGKLDTWRWIAHDVDEKSQLLSELYPYFICKKKQSLLAWNFLEISKQARGRNKGQEGNDNRNKCAWIVHSLSRLNHLESIDIPSWIKEPPSQYEEGYYLRQDVIWSKPNPMPESVTDRCTKAHEYIFLLAKSQKYYFDNEAIKEPDHPDGRKQTIRKQTNRYDGILLNKFQDNEHERWSGKRNKRSVWTVTTKPFKGAHFATFPEDLILPCVLAGCPKDGTILDPFSGAGTTGVVAKKNNRNFIGIELNEKYLKMAEQRINNTMGALW